MSLEAAVADLAASYSEDLVAPTLARLARLQAGSGKTCERCDERKPLAAYSRDSRNSDALRRYCRGCDSEGYRARVNADSA